MSLRISIIIFLLSFSRLCAQSAEEIAKSLTFVKANYTKYEYEIPMRDGKKLFTAVYAPKDTSQRYPILMTRTPYSVAPYGVDNYRPSLGPSEKFQTEFFIFVYQDVRGRYLSEGEFVEVRPKGAVDESTDAFDTVDWLIKNIPNNNGNAGIWGISYPGFYATAATIDAHPALVAASPQAPVTDYYMGDDSYHNGAFFLAANFGFYANFGKGKTEPALPDTSVPRFDYKNPNGYDFYLRAGPLSNFSEKYLKNQSPYWTEQIAHTNYDKFWQSRNISQHLANIKPSVLTVGGWFDAEDLSGPLKVFRSIAKNSPGTNNTIVMGPWSHGGWARSDGDSLGSVPFNAKTSLYFRENIEFPFFNYYLKGKSDPKLPKAYLFETGTNQWRKYDQWPPKDAQSRTLHLHANGKLSLDDGPSDGFDEYISDPNKPVPYIGYVAQGMVKEYMVDDQRFASSRTDVLTYETDVLASDITVAGPIHPTLHVSTTGTDSDFVVKLIDVYPNDVPPADKLGGYQQLVRGEPFRGKFRNSFEKPEAFAPGKEATIDFTMPDVNHTFRKGHRIMVQIQSSWFPLIDRNPQKFTMIPEAKAADFQKATQRIYRTSTITLGAAR